MILVVGSNRDDVLYIETKLQNKTETLIFDRYHFVEGTLFNQQVGVVYDVVTSYATTSVVSYLISKYFVILVISIGRARALSKDLKKGDIFVAQRAYFGEVNQIEINDSRLGQIPYVPEKFETDSLILQVMKEGFGKTSGKWAADGPLISMDRAPSNPKVIASINHLQYALGENTNVAFDCEAAGCYLAGYFNKVPTIAVRLIEGRVGDKLSVYDYADCLLSYADLSRGVVYAIGQICNSTFDYIFEG